MGSVTDFSTFQEHSFQPAEDSMGMENETRPISWSRPVDFQIQQKNAGNHPTSESTPRSTYVSADNIELERPDSGTSLAHDDSSPAIVPVKFPSPPPESELETMEQIRARMQALGQAEVINGRNMEALAAKRRRHDEKIARTRESQDRKITAALEFRRRQDMDLAQSRLTENDAFKPVEDQIEEEEKVNFVHEHIAATLLPGALLTASQFLRRRLKLLKRNLLHDQRTQPRPGTSTTSLTTPALSLSATPVPDTPGDTIPPSENGKTNVEQRASTLRAQPATERPPSPLSWFYQSHHTPTNTVLRHSGGSNNAIPPPPGPAIGISNTPSYTVDLPTAANTAGSSVNTGEVQFRTRTDNASFQQSASVLSGVHMDPNHLLQGGSIMSTGQGPSNSAPSNSAPSNSAPSNSAPSNSAPSNSAPSNSAPSNSAPSNSVSSRRTETQPRLDALEAFLWPSRLYPSTMKRSASQPPGPNSTIAVPSLRRDPVPLSQQPATKSDLVVSTPAAGHTVGPASALRELRQVCLLTNQSFSPGSHPRNNSRSSASSQVLCDQVSQTLESQLHAVPGLTPDESSEQATTDGTQKEDGDTIEAKAVPARRPRGRPRKSTLGP